MGYQVGNTCIDDRELAEDVYFSQVAPLITQDGLKQVVYLNGKWHLQKIQKTARGEFRIIEIQNLSIHLAECSPIENYKQGYELGLQLLPTAILLFCTGIIVKLFR